MPTSSVAAYQIYANISSSGVVVNILRVASPNAHAALGLLTDRSIIYGGDVVRISWELQTGHSKKGFYINSQPVNDQGVREITIAGNLSLIFLVEDGGSIVRIGSGKYMPYIADGTSWHPLKAYISTGSAWQRYSDL